jgi:uncharacterized protein (TIGR00369 family)
MTKTSSISPDGVDAVPEGFELFEASPFSVAAGPLYVNRSGPLPVIGVLLGAQHANTAGAGHGGLLLTIADIALGQAANALLPVGAVSVTLDLHAMFMIATELGQWLEVRPEVDRVGRSMIFATCVVVSGEQTVARMSGTFFVRSSGASQTEGDS